jgi:DNA-binding NtrC family response regulator
MDLVVETTVRPVTVPEFSTEVLALAQLHPEHRPECAATRLPLTVGRALTCALVLDHPSVSREHARLEKRGAALWISDLGSRNGCFVNRRRIQGSSEVRAGDILRLGDMVLRLVSRALDDHPVSSESLLVGGPSLADTRRLISLLGPTSLRILVRGKSGTGKELAARDLHRHSERVGPFIALNCAALPESLVETELFGHVKGAFTGALRDKPGLFEAAQGGTLFLDEVTELPAGTQAKLLRVVETGELRRVGSVSSVPTDCRIIAATNHDLEQDIAQGRFRGDLAARLAESEVVLPSLAERIEDLPLLIDHLTERAGCRITFDADAMEILACYAWPLNVRELDNLVRTLSVLSQGGEVGAERLPSHLATQPSGPPAPEGDDSMMDKVLEALRQNGGNIRKTSQQLGVSRTYIYRCLDRSGFDVRTARAGTGRASRAGH